MRVTGALSSRGAFLFREAAIVCLFSGMAVSGQNQQIDTGADRMVNSRDVKFAMEMAQAGAGEVQLGRLAIEKASSPEVKAFARQIVEERIKINDDLQSMAAKKAMTLPGDMNGSDHSKYEKLENLTGPAFDHEYVKDMVKDHVNDVKEFQREADKGKDSEIKAFASRNLPVIESHLAKIRSIQGSAR